MRWLPHKIDEWRITQRHCFVVFAKFSPDKFNQHFIKPFFVSKSGESEHLKIGKQVKITKLHQQFLIQTAVLHTYHFNLMVAYLHFFSITVEKTLIKKPENLENLSVRNNLYWPMLRNIYLYRFTTSWHNQLTSTYQPHRILFFQALSPLCISTLPLCSLKKSIW